MGASALTPPTPGSGEPVKVCLRINTTPNCNTPNAKTNTQITYTRVGDAFTLQEETNSTWNMGAPPSTTPANKTVNAGEYRFSFQVGEEALATTDTNPNGHWVVDVVATDDGGLTGNSTSTTVEMAYWSNITARPPTSFAQTAVGDVSATANSGNYTVKSNDSHDIQYATMAAWLSTGDTNVPLVTADPGNNREIALLCTDSAGTLNTSGGSPMYIGTGAADLDTATNASASGIGGTVRSDKCAVHLGFNIASATWTNAVNASIQRLD
ncbi:MAG: hypothetical protein IT198_12225 [Acidimicrobiia bacterium]|nr:hypothetical protein [Acidimicrobiia bacterium]